MSVYPTKKLSALAALPRSLALCQHRLSANLFDHLVGARLPAALPKRRSNLVLTGALLAFCPMLAPSHFGVIPDLRQPLRGLVGKVEGTCSRKK
jgi:hypothetical protein